MWWNLINVISLFCRQRELQERSMQCDNKLNEVREGSKESIRKKIPLKKYSNIVKYSTELVIVIWFFIYLRHTYLPGALFWVSSIIVTFINIIIYTHIRFHPNQFPYLHFRTHSRNLLLPLGQWKDQTLRNRRQNKRSPKRILHTRKDGKYDICST